MLYNLPKATEDLVRLEHKQYDSSAWLMALTILPPIKIRSVQQFFPRVSFFRVYGQISKFKLKLFGFPPWNFQEKPVVEAAKDKRFYFKALKWQKWLSSENFIHFLEQAFWLVIPLYPRHSVQEVLKLCSKTLFLS